MGRGPVDEVEVDIVGAEPLEAFIEGLERGVIALAVVPQLRRQEDVAACDAGLAKAFADAFLVFIDCGRVDVAIADLQSLAHRGCRFRVRRLPDAEADLRDGLAVVEFDLGLIHGVAPLWGGRAGDENAQSSDLLPHLHLKRRVSSDLLHSPNSEKWRVL